MNINATIARAVVLLFHSTQPNYARHDRVTPGRIGVDDFAGGHPVFDDRTGRQTIAEFIYWVALRAVEGSGEIDPVRAADLPGAKSDVI